MFGLRRLLSRRRRKSTSDSGDKAVFSDTVKADVEEAASVNDEMEEFVSANDEIEELLKPPGPNQTSLGDRAELHRLCNICRNALQTSPLISKRSYSALKPPDFAELHQLHKSLRHLRASVESRCHFCTLVWLVVKPYLAARANENQFQNLLRQAVTLEVRARHDTSPIDTLCELEIVCGDLMRDKRHGMLGCAGDRYPDMLVSFGQGLHTWSDSEPKYRRHSIHPAQMYFSTSSDEHMALARYWLTECSSKHSLCNSNVESGFIPTRILDVGKTGNNYVHLHCSHVEDSGAKYCTLSHTWGDVKDTLTLVNTNIATLQQGISLSALPKTFRDAVTVVRALNIQYLWIDSICIMQDSTDDWTKEAALMGSVYANSTCTIVASAAHGPHEGLFSSRDPLAFYGCKVAGSVEIGAFATYASTNAVLLAHSHLNSRGWIMQEWILSPRLLNFATGGVSWSCVHGEAMENERDGMGVEIARRSTGSAFYKQKPLQRIFGDHVQHVDWTVGSNDDSLNGNLRELEMYRQHGTLDDKLFLERFDRYWKHLVTLYSYRKFTDSDDKLVALSAIAQRLQKASGYTYLAGLWFPTLMTDLLWTGYRGRLIHSKYRAPSWSWASADGSISFPLYSDHQLKTEPIAHFQSGECTTHPLDTSKTGKVSDAQLRLTTKLRPWTTGLGEYFNSRHDLLLGGRAVGNLNPDEGPLDIHDARLEKLYLCPLRKFGFREFRLDEPMGIEGLAVVPHAGGSNHYERLGTFVSKSYHAAAETLLDGYLAQDIVLR